MILNILKQNIIKQFRILYRKIQLLLPKYIQPQGPTMY